MHRHCFFLSKNNHSVFTVYLMKYVNIGWQKICEHILTSMWSKSELIYCVFKGNLYIIFPACLSQLLCNGWRLMNMTFIDLFMFNNSIHVIVLLLYVPVNSYGNGWPVSSPNHTFSWARLNKQLTSASSTYFRFSGREQNDRRNYFLINLHKSMGPGQDGPLDLQSDTYILTWPENYAGQSMRNGVLYDTNKYTIIVQYKGK